jgi:hypothetical protein
MTAQMKRFPNVAPVVCVFGSSLVAEGSAPYEEARNVGSLLARAGYRVCSGGYGGTMEAVSRGTKEAGGSTIGVTTNWFSALKPNQWLDQEIRTDTYLERLLKLVVIGSAYLAVHGGVGTLTEISLVWSLIQTHSLSGRPLVLLTRPWEDLLSLARDSFITRPGDLAIPQLADTLEDAVRLIDTGLKGL